jgi:hypothetical protein
MPSKYDLKRLMRFSASDSGNFGLNIFAESDFR